MDLKVLFVNTPFKYIRMGSTIPSGLLSLGTILKNQGFDVNLIDISAEKPIKATAFGGPENNLKAQLLSPKEFLQRVKAYEPDIIGISSFTENYPIAMKIANICKKENDNIKIIFGGIHATFQAVDCLNENPYIDIVIRGEAEHIILDVLKAIQGIKELKQVNNVVFRDNGLIKFSQDFSLPDLNQIPPPDLELIKGKYYPPTVQLEFSRGCPFQCVFCCVSPFSNREVRYFPIKFILNTLMAYQEKFEKFSFALQDSNFLFHSKKVKNLFQEIKERKIELDNWLFQSSVTTINREILKYLRENNASRIFLGIEETHDSVLRCIGKQQTFNQIKKAIRILHELDFTIHANFMIGLPSQTREQMLENIVFSKKIDYGTFPCLVPFPGSAIFYNPKKFGLKILSNDWELYTLREIVMDSETFPINQQEGIRELAWRELAERELEKDSTFYFQRNEYERLLEVSFEVWNEEWKKAHKSGWN